METFTQTPRQICARQDLTWSYKCLVLFHILNTLGTLICVRVCEYSGVFACTYETKIQWTSQPCHHTFKNTLWVTNIFCSVHFYSCSADSQQKLSQGSKNLIKSLIPFMQQAVGSCAKLYVWIHSSLICASRNFFSILTYTFTVLVVVHMNEMFCSSSTITNINIHLQEWSKWLQLVCT